MFTLDKADIQILELLQKDSKMTLQNIADAVNMSIPPCQKRLQKLRENGIITRDTIIIDYNKITNTNIAFTHLKLSKHTEAVLNTLTDELDKIDCIVDVYNISGEYDFLIKLQITNMQHYSDIIYSLTEKVPEIINFNTEFVIKANKRKIQAPVSSIIEKD